MQKVQRTLHFGTRWFEKGEALRRDFAAISFGHAWFLLRA